MKRFLIGTIALSSTGLQISAQSFSRQVACPNEPTLLGYSSIIDLNNDMTDELARIEAGGTIPAEGYDLSLCPGQTYDATGGNVIRPVLNNIVIRCGGADSVNPECILDGNREQVVVSDSTVDGYTISSVTLDGITFNDVTRGVSVTLDLTPPAVFQCIDCIFQNFHDADYVIESKTAMTIRLENTVFQTTEGTATAVVNDALIRSPGGAVELTGVVIQDIAADLDIFQITDGGTLLVSNTQISGNSIQRNLARAESANVIFNSVTIDNCQSMESLFFGTGAETRFLLGSTTISNNQSDEPWSGVHVEGGAGVTMTDSTFASNQNLLYGITAQGSESGLSWAYVESSKFTNNRGGTGTSNPTSLVSAIGNGFGEPFVDLLKIDFIGNSGFTGNILTNTGGRFRVLQSCFEGNSNVLVAFLGSDGQDLTDRYNYISDGELSAGCTGNQNRVGIEAPDSQGCFLDSSLQCLVDCSGGLDDSDECLSQVTVTEEPSAFPSMEPTMEPSVSSSESPTLSASPSLSPSAGSSAPPSAAPSDLGSPPSNTPSSIPSALPSVTPTIGTSSPSSIPSSTPSLTPSVQDSSLPTTSGSQPPSASLVPSAPPTFSFLPTFSMDNNTFSPAPTSNDTSLEPTTDPTFEPTTEVEVPTYVAPPIFRAPLSPPSVRPTFALPAVKPPYSRPTCGKGEGKGSCRSGKRSSSLSTKASGKGYGGKGSGKSGKGEVMYTERTGSGISTASYSSNAPATQGSSASPAIAMSGSANYWSAMGDVTGIYRSFNFDESTSQTTKRLASSGNGILFPAEENPVDED